MAMTIYSQNIINNWESDTQLGRERDFCDLLDYEIIDWVESQEDAGHYIVDISNMLYSLMLASRSAYLAITVPFMRRDDLLELREMLIGTGENPDHGVGFRNRLAQRVFHRRTLKGIVARN